MPASFQVPCLGGLHSEATHYKPSSGYFLQHSFQEHGTQSFSLSILAEFREGIAMLARAGGHPAVLDKILFLLIGPCWDTGPAKRHPTLHPLLQGIWLLVPRQEGRTKALLTFKGLSELT